MSEGIGSQNTSRARSAYLSGRNSCANTTGDAGFSNAAGATGWVSSRFVAYVGATDDITALVVDRVGEIPSAETMLDLADIVAGVMKSQGEPESRITVTVAPEVGDVGEVTMDILGFGDDALFGIRLVIFGQPIADGEGFSLMSVESTSLCGRGASADGLCA